MTKPKILLQLDTDRFPSSFDSIVAIDAGVDQLLTYSQVTTADVESIVHGGMFTRSPEDLKRTAIFIGGSQVEEVAAIVRRVEDCFFGPIRISYLVDPNGSNTTAAAGVLAVLKHMDLATKSIALLGGTGPVGRRIGHLIGYELSKQQQTADVLLVSRLIERAAKVCEELQSNYDQVAYRPVASTATQATWDAVSECDIVFAAGAAGVELLPSEWMAQSKKPQLVIDLNAVPPVGLPGVKSTDKGVDRNGVICYGAIGIGGSKMKIHKACLQALFADNQGRLMTEEIYQLGRQLDS
jgi:hypothetical protein